MATTPCEPSNVGAALFDIYNDTLPISNSIVLPSGGPCHFKDANKVRCGCQRLMTRSSITPDHSGVCNCDHHACYHEERSREGVARSQTPVQEANPQVAEQENKKPSTGREPLSPVMDLSIKVPPAVPGMDFHSFNGGLSFLQDKPEESAHRPRIPASPHPASPHPASSIPDTLNWGGFVQTPPDPHTLPPIPAQCLISSQTASSGPSNQAKYTRPFAGKGLHTLSPGSLPKARSSPRGKSNRSEPMVIVHEATSAPSAADSFVFDSQSHRCFDDVPNGTPTQTEPRVAAVSSVSRRAFKNLSETVSGHEQRLDRLETVSFSSPGHEDCDEKHDHTDLRVTELESRVGEVERLVSDSTGAASRHGWRDDVSIISADTSITSRPTHSQELYSQVQSLQAQVFRLQSIMPSVTHPWEVEVVYLPFPLMRIWQKIDQFKNQPQMDSDDWARLPMSYSTATMRSQSPYHADWANPEHDADWLLPKACASGSIIDRRLRSRGLVKTVSVKGYDARSVAMAMNSAFGGVLRQMHADFPQKQNDPRVPRFIGLQSPWVPLRKIHMDSRLRFLSPSEMMTSTLWDVQFLSTVIMRSSEPRLFVTHPDAYLQNEQAYVAGWTWRQLQELGPASLDECDTQATIDDAHNGCWAWIPPLDDPINPDVPMQSACPEQARMSTSPSQQYFATEKVWRARSPAVARASSPMVGIAVARASSPMVGIAVARASSPIVKSREGSRPPCIQPGSEPVTTPIRNSPARTRRRISSSGQSRRSLRGVRGVTPQSGVTKSWRTRSPNRAQLTPRGTTSPTPIPTPNDRHTGRGTTPSAYATPHSNAPPYDPRYVRGSSTLRQETQLTSDGDVDNEAEVHQSDSEIYEGIEDDGNESSSNVQMASHAQRLSPFQAWMGIEYKRHGSDQRSDANSIGSAPSEMTSKRNALCSHGNDIVDFDIHEDDHHRY